jgi:hypothetical protein
LDEKYHWGRHDALKLKNIELDAFAQHVQPTTANQHDGRSDSQRADINSGKVRATRELFGTD